MNVTIANSTLPTMCQVMCTLVATGIPGVNVIDSAMSQALLPLPDGYVGYADIGFAYKIHNENMTWPEARRHCTKEGAQLALIDSDKKIEYILNQGLNVSYAHVGIISMYDIDMWIGVTTGLPTSSLPWETDAPNDVDTCVGLSLETKKLSNYDCYIADSFICERPILDKNPIATN